MLTSAAFAPAAGAQGFEIVRLREETLEAVPVEGLYQGQLAARRFDAVLALGASWDQDTRAVGGALRYSRVDLELFQGVSEAPPGSLYGTRADFGYVHGSGPRRAWIGFGSLGRFSDEPSGAPTRWVAGMMHEWDAEARGKIALGGLYVADLAGGVWWPALDYAYRDGPLRILFSFPSDTETLDLRYDFAGTWQAGAQIRTPGNQYRITAPNARLDELHYAAWTATVLLGWGREPGVLVQAQAGVSFHRQFDTYRDGHRTGTLNLGSAPVYALVVSWRV